MHKTRTRTRTHDAYFGDVRAYPSLSNPCSAYDRGVQMINVTAKEVSERSACARGSVLTTAEVIAAIRNSTLVKGDVLAAARIAGIMAVKRTPDLIPLCHPIAIGGAQVDLQLIDAGEVEITTRVTTADRTGVEMEALTAVAAAGLTIIDMIKSLDPAASIEHVRVESKSGGKTGDWERPAPR